MQEARHCGEQALDRTCDEDILVTFGFTLCIGKPWDSTNLPWVVLGTMIVSLLSAYTVAIVCITVNLDRSCGPGENGTAPVTSRQVAGWNDTIQCNRTAGQCGRNGSWYCASFPEAEQCSPATSSISPPRTSTPTTAPSTTAPPTAAPTAAPTTSRTWCRCPTPSGEPDSSPEQSLDLTFRVEREVDGLRRVETVVGNEIFLDEEMEVEIEMGGCEQVRTDVMRHNEITISIDEE